MEKENVEGKRISLKRKAANPLFREWLTDLHEEAKAKKSRLETILKDALTSLSKYPLPLHSGAECAILKGFDRKLCKYLDKNLEVYNKCVSKQEFSSPNSQDNVDTVASSCDTNISRKSKTQHNSEVQGIATPPVPENLPVSRTNSAGSNNSKKSNKSYKPKFRSGSFALLLALYEQSSCNPSEPSLNKENLIERAQKHSEESFTRPKPDSFYTAWSNMANLIKKGLVKQVRSKRVLYSLTEEGETLARQLLEESKNIPTMNDIIFNVAREPSCSKAPEPMESENSPAVLGNDGQNLGPHSSDANINAEDFVQLQAGTFHVILLIDKHEIGKSSNKNNPTVAQFNKYPGLKHEYRDLKVGDYTWVARHKTDRDIELVLPFVIERKRMDDFGASVKDGRFHEQKFRLRKCGIPNVIYLIENYGSNKNVGLPMQSLMQALANTRVQDDFKVHLTASLTDSARFLAMMTKRLTLEYEDRNLVGCNRDPCDNELMTFKYFNHSSLKNKALTVADTFVKLLLQVKGLSVEKAVAIAQQYKTPKALQEEYKKCESSKQAEMLLANIKYGDRSRNIGQSLSNTIYQTFTWKH